MSRSRLLALTLAGVVLIGTVLWAVWPRRADGDAIFVSGNIELIDVALAFKIAGKVVELNVDEGDRVDQGTIVARLDPVQLQKRREQALATVASLRSRLSEIEALIRFQQATMEGESARRKAELRLAQARLDELSAGFRSQEVEDARAAVEQAEARHRVAESNWHRARSLYETEDVSRARYDRYKSAFEAAEASLKQVRERLALVVEGPRRERIEAAKAQVAAARAALRLVQARHLEIERNERSEETLGAEIRRAEAQVALIDNQLGDALAIAPIDGVVLVKSAEPGEILAAGTPALTLGDLAHPWLRAYISEKDLGRIRLGLPVKLTTDSYPGKIY
ncbi:MAG: HlyD family efflux transporter periplasmic adaptor subunit, partial [Acidobacteriota bacterium]